MKSIINKSGLLVIILILSSLFSCKNKVEEITEANRMQWWNDAKFGLFIHWGVYSVPAGTYDGKKIDGIGEWIMYNGEIPVASYKD